MSSQTTPQTMKVVIVAKTRQGGGACIGGLSFAGRSVRLLHPNPDTDPNPNMDYAVGDVWEIVWQPCHDRPLPHVEDITVLSKRRLAPMGDLFDFIHHHMSPHRGGPDVLYGGLLQSTNKGALYIAERTGVPDHSTTFWVPDRPLVREIGTKRIHYRYPTADGGHRLTFVGFQETVEEIPAGTLLRVSLAHWWRPDELPDGELRCHAQLSGWILPSEMDAFFSDDWSASLPAEPVSEPARTMSAKPLPAPVPTPTLPPTLDSARTLLKQIFGYDSFRPLQAEVMGNVLECRDTLAIMPTGSGKSLCYQIPALLFEGLTVVVSPLISLMQDQVEALRDSGVAAAYLNSSLVYSEYDQIVAQVRSGQIKLLYVAPETLLLPATLALLDACRVDCLTIDEAHCISQWGHDFRPEYRQLIDVRRRLPAAVCIAVTATATPRVQADIKQSLGFGESDTFLASFDRPNLFLGVLPRQDGPSQVLSFIEDHKEQSGIIYCSTRKEVDSLTSILQRRGVSVLPYHAGLDNRIRSENQRAFVRDQVSVMVATVAFGMGIDKPDVRFILHYNLPKDLESYYQQIGRAGRDGLRADCVLLFSYADLRTIRFFIDQQAPEEQRGANVRLSAMVGFGETDECRRRPLLGYFGETYAAGGGGGDDGCGICDNCTAEAQEQVDLTIPAQKFLSCVVRTKQRFGLTHIIDVLRGSKNQKVRQFSHDKLSTYNIGGEFSKQEWSYLARLFIQKGLLEQDITHGGLSLTEKGRAVFAGEKVMGALQPREQAGPVVSETVDHDAGLFQRLRILRRELADAAGLPPYMVFGDRSLMEMAAYFPHSRERFLQMHGVGQAKADRYADAFLPVIRAYCAEHDLAERPKTDSTAVAGATSVRRLGGGSAGSRTHEIAGAFNGGRTIAQLAAEFGIARSTVVNHLWKYLQAGQPLKSAGFRQDSRLDPATQQRVLAAFAELGPDLLRPVYDALNETVDWDELHIMRLWFVSEQKSED